ncbi:hypothetical protein MM1218R_03282 [Mycobacterium marinum]|nr:hypothetical protein MM1218R_03282 [Mycobacterium marinum]
MGLVSLVVSGARVACTVVSVGPYVDQEASHEPGGGRLHRRGSRDEWWLGSRSA